MRNMILEAPAQRLQSTAIEPQMDMEEMQDEKEVLREVSPVSTDESRRLDE